ncbi:MAG: aminotransferase class V-fold PLP-dependent enzyme, partial [Patescibacteria group bacterium]|nr:aminotransferase class V-fold PLP-dependent enzyme [Patescibacteria group bacterium]
QAVWTENLTRAHFAADLLTLDASKVSLARGIGALVAPRKVPLAPLYAGGGQERGLVPGSEAPALAAAFAEGLARAAAGRETFRAAALAAREKLIATIYATVPGALVNESPRAQAPNVLNLSLPGRDTDYLVALLDEAGFAASTKSACESASGEGSRAVLALSGDPERAAATLRISWGRETHARDLDRFAAALARAVAFVDSNGAE